MPSLKDFDNLDESEEQNDVSLTDADIENNVDELAFVQENFSDENSQQKAETVKYLQK